MTRMTLVFIVIALVVIGAGSVWATDQAKTMPMPAKAGYLTGEEPGAPVQYRPSTPGTICSPGDTMGFTQYDYQSNGSTGRRVVVDAQGGVHFDWMCGDPYPTVRNIKYNCFTPGSPSPWPGIGTTISYRNGAGYPQLSVMSDGRAVAAFHQAPTGAESLFTAVDQFECLGAFYYGHPPNRSGVNKMIWPYVTVDRNNRIQLVATTTVTGLTYSYEPFEYTRSNNGGTTWTAVALVDTLRTISPIIVSSRVSDKVAIVYTHPSDTTAGRTNIYYIQSADGITWNSFSPKVNVTNYHRNGDSLYAWSEVSALYDFNDNLHIVWPASYVTGAPNSSPSFYYGRAHVYHWDAASNTINSFASFDTTWPSAGCDMPLGSFVYSKVSLSADSSNNLCVTYTSWDTSDCSLAGFANGDIYAHFSHDNGATWSPKMNLTNSHSPACAAGDCESDSWSSQAEITTDGGMAHILYVNDKDAGGVVYTEGIATDNPMLHLAFHVDAVSDDIQQPKSFSLAQNYPNPFNAKTNIDFELVTPAFVDLTVYDITGARITNLISANLDAGKHQVNWDASRVASGVYYYTLRANGSEVTKKMTLLK
jgi:hypothetical protein